MKQTVDILVNALVTFIISAGGALMAAMTAAGTVSSDLPPKGVILVCAVTGLVAAAQSVQKQISPPPQSDAPGH